MTTATDGSLTQMQAPLLERARVALRIILTINMVGIGILHFTADYLFVQIVPPALPWPYFLVWFSGVVEISLGFGLLPAVTRRSAGYGLTALYLAVFPANIYMAVAHVRIHGLPSWLPEPSAAAAWLRLPFQAMFILWGLWVAEIIPRRAST
jgi:uncharacterized membrane protein